VVQGFLEALSSFQNPCPRSFSMFSFLFLLLGSHSVFISH
jgi:hypothetical protein